MKSERAFSKRFYRSLVMNNDKLEERGCQGKPEGLGEVTMKAVWAVEEPEITQTSLYE